jgi:hypothetical protein
MTPHWESDFVVRLMRRDLRGRMIGFMLRDGLFGGKEWVEYNTPA